VRFKLPSLAPLSTSPTYSDSVVSKFNRKIGHHFFEIAGHQIFEMTVHLLEMDGHDKLKYAST